MRDRDTEARSPRSAPESQRLVSGRERLTFSAPALLRHAGNWLCSQDLIVLMLALLVIGCVWGFVELADEVTEGETLRFDERLVLALRSTEDPADPVGPVWFEEAVRDITALGSVTVVTMVSIAAAGFLLLRRQHHALVFLVVALAGSGFLNVVLKEYFDRPRPDLVPHLLRVSSHSFPSGHSLMAMAGYLTIGSLLVRLVKDRRSKIYILSHALLLALLIGASRVYLGVHYPSDVLAGWTLGLTWAVLCWLVMRTLQTRGTIEKPK